MQSNSTYEPTPRTQRDARPPVVFKAREQQRQQRSVQWERNDQRRRQHDMMQ